MKSKVSILRCNSYAPSLVEETTRKAIDLLGGISNFIRPGSSVLVKPNLLMAKGPEFGIDTHPELVRAVVKMLKRIKCSIFVGDGPGAWGSHVEEVDRVYEVSGMKRICQEESVTLIKFDKRRWQDKFPLTTWIDKCDYLVNLPKFKTHNLTTLTGAVKNLYGLVCGTYKTELHKRYYYPRDFSKIVVDIFQAAKPALTIVDGIVAMEGDGPGTTGKLRNLNLLLAGADCVALDSILALIMGLEPSDILTTKEATTRGLGVSDLDSIEIQGLRLEEVTNQRFLLPATSFKTNLPRPVVNLAKKLIKYYPCVEYDNCIKCAACIKACPHKAISMKNDRIAFDYSKCLACFCCLEACPSSAIKLKKSIFAKALGL